MTPENSNLHQGFGIQTLPFGHVYYPQAGLVEEMMISRKYFSKFVHALQTYIQGYCVLPTNDIDDDKYDDHKDKKQSDKENHTTDDNNDSITNNESSIKGL